MGDRDPDRPLPPSSSASSAATPPICDFCADNVAFLYCRADSARLCLLCDYQVHIANSLSLKHARFPLCQSCGSHPSSLKRHGEGGVEEEGVEEGKSFFICHSCHEEEEEEEEERNKATELFHDHKRKAKKITPLTGRLTPAEISKCWSWKVDDANSLLKDDMYLFKKSLLSLPDIWSTLDGCGISFPSTCWGNNSDSFLVPEVNELSFRGTPAHHPMCPQKRAFKEQLERLLKQQYVAEAVSPGLHYDSEYSTEQFVMAQTHNDLDTDQKCRLSSQQDVGYVHTLMSKLEENGTCPNKYVWYGNSVKASLLLNTSTTTF